MKHFLASHRWAPLFGCALLIEGVLLLWGGPLLTSRHGDFAVTLPLAVPAQVLPVMLIVASGYSEHFWLEENASRRLVLPRLLGFLIGFIPVLLMSLLVSHIHNTGSTLAWYAPAAGLIGAVGMSLCVAPLFGFRMAGVFSVIPLTSLLIVDPTTILGYEFWCFLASTETWSNAAVPGLWLITGLSVFMYAERLRLGLLA